MLRSNEKWFGMIGAIVVYLAFVGMARADWQQQDKLLSLDGSAGDSFGISVSISGDYAIAGAVTVDGWTGSAYIFKRSDIPDDPNWYQQAQLFASDGTYHEHFGSYVSINGDYCLVGAPHDDDKGTSSGSVYIFKRDGTDWIEQAKLLASDGAAGDLFGCGISISGDYAIVGALYDDDSGSNSGSAYIFKRSDVPDDPNWYQQAKLLASDGEAGDWFGFSVSINGDYCLVGAGSDDDNGTDSGSAYIFKRSDVPDDPNWYEQCKLTASDGEADDRFGYVNSASIDANYAIVGAYTDDDNGTNSGSAYVFKRSDIPDDPNWYQQVKLLASDGVAGDRFGSSVSIDANYAIIGAYLDDDNGDSSGSAYIFKRRGTSWIEVDKIMASDGISKDFFGLSVSISGDYAIAGAYHLYPSPYPGSAYIFVRGPMLVEIDIKPGSYPNAINLGSQGLIPVAILSSEDFDATTVDPETVELAGSGVEVRGKGNKYLAHEEYVNEDDLLDLVVQVATANLDPDSFQDGWVVLTAKTYDGQDIEGWDEVTIVPPKQ